MMYVMPSTRFPFSIPPCKMMLSGRSLVSSLAPPLSCCSSMAACLCGSISSLLIDQSSKSLDHCPKVYLGSISGAHTGGKRPAAPPLWPWLPGYIHTSSAKIISALAATNMTVQVPCSVPWSWSP